VKGLNGPGRRYPDGVTKTGTKGGEKDNSLIRGDLRPVRPAEEGFLQLRADGKTDPILYFSKGHGRAKLSKKRKTRGRGKGRQLLKPMRDSNGGTP